MGNFVLFREYQKSNIVKKAEELKGKTAGEILQMFQHEDLVLFVTTPFYSEPIDKSAIPLQLYPEVVLSSKPHEKEDLHLEEELPNAYFSFKELTFPHQISLFVCSDVQEVQIPPFEVIIDLESVYDGNDIFELIDHSFTMKHSDPSTTSFTLKESASTIIARAKTENILFHFNLSESSHKLIKKRISILQEMQETEKNYIHDIQMLIDFWEPNVRQLRIFNESELSQIFKDFPTIYKCHQSFLESLKQRGCEFSAIVGDVFLEFSDYFKLSLPYISSYHTIIQILNSKPRILTLNDPENGKDLTSYLITPVQRIPRYILYLKELLKKTPTFHPDYIELELASSRIQNITIEMDISTKKAQQMNEIWMIQKSLTKPFSLISPNRCLKYTLDITFKSEPCHLYLFNDFILIASYDKRSQTVLLGSSLLNFHYFPCFSQIGFQIKKKIYYAQFKNEEKRQEFVSNLEDLRLSQDKRSSADLSMFLWSNPFVPKYLPKLSFIDGVQVNDSYVFFGDGTLVTINMKIGAVTSIQSPFGSRMGFAMTSNNTDRIFIIGGYVKQTDEYYNDIWQYELFLNKWTNLTKTISCREFQSRCEHVAVYDDNKIYVFGGRSRKNFLNDVSIFYLTTKKWNVLKLDKSPPPRSLHSAVMIEKSIIVLGGHNQQTVFNDVNVFDTNTLEWKSVLVNCSIIPKRYGHRSIALQDMIVIIGGTVDGETVQKPSVISVSDNYSCKSYKCAGNYPFNEHIEGHFAVCFDREKLNMYVYNHCSIFLVQLPQDVKQTYVCNAQNEIHGRLFHTTVASSKRLSATIEEGDMFQSIQNRRRMQKFGTCYVPKSKNLNAFPRSRRRMHVDRKAMMLPDNEFTGIMTKLPNTIQYSDLKTDPKPSTFSVSMSDDENSEGSIPKKKKKLFSTSTSTTTESSSRDNSSNSENESEGKKSGPHKKSKKSKKNKRNHSPAGSSSENEGSHKIEEKIEKKFKNFFKKKSTSSQNSDTEAKTSKKAEVNEKSTNNNEKIVNNNEKIVNNDENDNDASKSSSEKIPVINIELESQKNDDNKNKSKNVALFGSTMINTKHNFLNNESESNQQPAVVINSSNSTPAFSNKAEKEIPNCLKNGAQANHPFMKSSSITSTANDESYATGSPSASISGSSTDSAASLLVPASSSEIRRENVLSKNANNSSNIRMAELSSTRSVLSNSILSSSQTQPINNSFDSVPLESESSSDLVKVPAKDD